VIAGIYNFTIEQGTTFYKVMTLSASSAPVNLTGYQARMQIRPEIESGEVLAELTTGNGLITLSSAGQITWTIPAATTEGITVDGFYDMELIEPGGAIKRLLKGRVRLDREVTRDD
jgi:hypothetical protein